MNKPLDKMSNMELGKLFPIILAPHDRMWKTQATAEIEMITRVIGRENVCRISHIGSTSVDGLLAKPTIDILLEITAPCDTALLNRRLQEAGWLFSPQPKTPPPHMMFMKGYTPEGFRGQTFHLHVRYRGDWDELYFRDYLQTHAEARMEYAELKTCLKERYEHDRDAYTEAKGAFIRERTKIARQEIGPIYI